MKFLLDQDVYAVTALLLTGLGHDVITARQLGMSRADDEELLRVAHSQTRIFATRDRDFGNPVFVQGMKGGVVYLRLLPATMNVVHDEFERVINDYSEQELLSAFIVVEAGGHRIRRLSESPREGNV